LLKKQTNQVEKIKILKQELVIALKTHQTRWDHLTAKGESVNCIKQIYKSLYFDSFVVVNHPVKV